MDLIHTIVETTEQVFTDMVALSASAGTSFERKGLPPHESIAGVIHLSGKYTGYAAIHLPSTVAALVTSSMMYMELDKVTEENVSDSVGELANILAGNIKSALDSSGRAIRLSWPMLVHGQDFAADRLPGATPITVPFYLDDGEFLVEVQLKESRTSCSDS